MSVVESILIFTPIVLPFLFPIVATILVLIAVPGLATWLPNLIGC